MSDATFGIDIVGNNRVERGARAAEQRLGRISRAAGRSERRHAADNDRFQRQQARSTIRRFSEVEQATARAFGGRSLTAGLATRLGALRTAGTAAGSGLGEAAVQGGLLRMALVGVGGAAITGIGLLAGAAMVALKLADSFGKGALKAGQLANLIGVSTSELTRFQAAAERVGVDKEAAAQGLGGLSQTLNDARFGRNTEAQALLAKMGVGMKLKADGDVDVMAMAPMIANALQRQSSSGARTASRMLGIPDSALPAFRQGGRQLAADYNDVGRNAMVLDENDVALGGRIVRRHAAVQQKAERETIGRWRRGIAQGTDTAESFAVERFSNAIGRSFVPGAEKIDRAATRMERAAAGGGGGAGGGGLRNGVLNLSSQDVIDLKKTVATEWNRRSVGQGRGVVDTILNRYASGHWGSNVAAVVNARSQFSDVNGRPAWQRGRHSVSEIPMSRIDSKTDALVSSWLAARSRGARSSVGDNLNYANPYVSDARNRPWINRLDGPVFGEGKSVHRHGTTPDLQRYRPGDFQVSSPGQSVQLEHHVVVDDRRTTVKSSVRNDRGGAPAVSYGYAPVRGG